MFVVLNTNQVSRELIEGRVCARDESSLSLQLGLMRTALVA